MAKNEPRFLCVGEVAHRLRQSESTIGRKIREGELPAVRLGHGPRSPLRIDAGELEAWLFEIPPAGSVSWPASDSRPSGAVEAARSPRGGLEEDSRGDRLPRGLASCGAGCAS